MSVATISSAVQSGKACCLIPVDCAEELRREYQGRVIDAGAYARERAQLAVNASSQSQQGADQ
jgi:hypothetical protein